MGTTAEKLQAVLNSKTAIKTALENKGKTPGDLFSGYAQIIESMMDLQPQVLSFEIAENNQPSKILCAATDGNRIVALRKNGDGAYSDDGGNTWTEFDNAAGAWGYKDMIYAKGKYYAVAESTSDIYYSSDGINWLEGDIGDVATWRGIAYAKGIFVAVGNGTKASYSLDGEAWTMTTLPASLNWSAVEWCGDRFIAVARDSATAAYSFDGETWNSLELPASAKWGRIAYGNGTTIILATTENGNYTKEYLVSNNNQVFTFKEFSSSRNFKDIAFYNGVWVATSSSSSRGEIHYSYDGINWTLKSLSGAAQTAFIVFMGDGKIVLVSCPVNVLDTEEPPGAVTINTKIPSEATFLGDATPEEVPEGVVFTSIHGFGLIGTKAVETADTYVITNAARTHSVPAVLVSKN